MSLLISYRRSSMWPAKDVTRLCHPPISIVTISIVTISIMNSPASSGATSKYGRQWTDKKRSMNHHAPSNLNCYAFQKTQYFQIFEKKCGRWDLNPHDIAATRSLVLLVCQFRHFRSLHFFLSESLMISWNKRNAGKGTWTLTVLPQQAPEACASANSAIPANKCYFIAWFSSCQLNFLNFWNFQYKTKF